MIKITVKFLDTYFFDNSSLIYSICRDKLDNVDDAKECAQSFYIHALRYCV